MDVLQRKKMDVKLLALNVAGINNIIKRCIFDRKKDGNTEHAGNQGN